MNNVTTVEQLKTVNPYKVVELSPFSDGTPLMVKIKPLSLMNLVHNGMTINPLLRYAAEIMGDKENESTAEKAAAENIEETAELFKVIQEAVKSVLIEPQYSDIEQYAGGLTDKQIFEIYTAATQEVNDLATFR